MNDEPVELTGELTACCRQVLITHGSVYGVSMRHVCRAARCPDGVDAYGKLAAAHKLMTDELGAGAVQSEAR